MRSVVLNLLKLKLLGVFLVQVFCFAQEQVKIYFYQHLETVSNQLSVDLQSQDKRYQLISKEVRTNNLGVSCIDHTYCSEEYKIKMRIFVYKDQDQPREVFKRSLVTSGGLVGVPIDLGDEAQSWSDGRLYIRKGTILVFLYLYPKDFFEKTPDQPTNLNEQPENSVPVTLAATQRDLSKQFAKHILNFLETQR